MNPKRILVDDGIGPDASDEVGLGDQFARALDQRRQDVERAATETNRRFAFQQQLLRRKKAEGAE